MHKKAPKKVRVVLYVPIEIDSFVQDSCERIIKAMGREVKFTKSKNEAYLEFIKRGIASLEDEEEEKEEVS